MFIPANFSPELRCEQEVPHTAVPFSDMAFVLFSVHITVLGNIKEITKFTNCPPSIYNVNILNNFKNKKGLRNLKEENCNLTVGSGVF